MPGLDDKLQDLLSALEGGASSEEVTANLKRGETKLAPLVEMAVGLRDFPHPRIDPAKAREHQKRMMDEAARQWSQPRRRIWLRISLAGAFMTLLMIAAFLSVFASTYLLLTARRAQTVTLENITGNVEAAAARNMDDWWVLKNGERLHSGQHVRTGDSSYARLFFNDGSTTLLGPNTELALITVEMDWGKLRVELAQESGRTIHRIKPLNEQGSYFLINTPSGSARVQGTTFSVTVKPSGESHFVVDSGRLSVIAQGQEIILASGQVTTIFPGEVPAPPAYQFTGQGQIMGGSGMIWLIGGISILITDQTQFGGEVHAGDFVAVTGRILGDGTWSADRVERTSGSGAYFSFTGPLEMVSTGTLQVAGVYLRVNDSTVVDASLKPGDLVMASFTVLEDGTRLALKIRLLEEGPSEPVPTPEPTTNPTTSPSPSLEPREASPSPAATKAPTQIQDTVPKPAGRPDKVQVCHRPPGNPAAAHTITIGQPALLDHLNHGDTLGPCP